MFVSILLTSTSCISCMFADSTALLALLISSTSGIA